MWEVCRETIRCRAGGMLLPPQGPRDTERVITGAGERASITWQHLGSWLEGGNRGTKCLTSCFALISYGFPLPKLDTREESGKGAGVCSCGPYRSASWYREGGEKVESGSGMANGRHTTQGP